MMKHEFEALALRGNAEIGPMLYDSIERFYMSTNDYHRAHGGIEETKQDFVKRVFGGKVNTPKTITLKLTAEAIRENRWALRGNRTADEQRLDEMDHQIQRHYQNMLRWAM